jgi:hypothetical protein
MLIPIICAGTGSEKKRMRTVTHSYRASRMMPKSRLNQRFQAVEIIYHGDACFSACAVRFSR